MPLKPLSNVSLALLLVASFSVCGSILFGLYYPPVIVAQGEAHRIFYIHVPIAWVALYSPTIGAVAGLLFLFTRSDRMDTLVLVSMKLGFLFALGVVITGPIWASTEWGVYWNWKDTRLMSFFILLLSMGGFFLVRGFTEDPRRQSLYSAILAILCTGAAGLTWFAIRVTSPDTHPTSVLGAMSPRIRIAFWVGVVGFHVFFLVLFFLTYRFETLRKWERQQ